jgi:hypothetical protein
MSENATRCVPRSSGDGYGWPYPGLGPIGARPRVQGYGPGEAEAGPCTHGSDRYPTRTALHLPHLQEEPSRARQDTAAACTSCRTDFSWYTLTNADLNRILDGVSSAASRLTAPLGLSRGCSDHGHGPRDTPNRACGYSCAAMPTKGLSRRSPRRCPRVTRGFGGRLDVESPPGGGTLAAAAIPIAD